MGDRRRRGGETDDRALRLCLMLTTVLALTVGCGGAGDRQAPRRPRQHDSGRERRDCKEASSVGCPRRSP